jgi:hypothetical protein
MKIVYVIVLITVISIPLIRFVTPNIALIGCIALIIMGILFDLIDFSLRLISFLRRKHVQSAGMFVGLVLMSIGLYGLTVNSSFLTLFDWSQWKNFFVFTGLALLLHIFIHIILPLFFTISCNLYYGRKMFDMTPLPPLNNNSG